MKAKLLKCEFFLLGIILAVGLGGCGGGGGNGNANLVGLFVDGNNGNDASGDGTQGNPFATISKALSEAKSKQPELVDIHVQTLEAGASYDETAGTLTIPAGVSLYGGYDGNWNRNVANNKTKVSGAFKAVDFEPVDADVWLSGFEILAASTASLDIDGIFGVHAAQGSATLHLEDNIITAGDLSGTPTSSSRASYGVYAANLRDLQMKRNTVTAGNGSPTAINGLDRIIPGSNGSDGKHAVFASHEGALGGSSVPKGGNGGDAGASAFSDGNPGTKGQDGDCGSSIGGGGGSGGKSQMTTGRPGEDGQNGNAGDIGAGGDGHGSISPGGYFLVVSGIAGNKGCDGGGGGGGGGGRSIFPNGGGGGGGGGSGGRGGPGGGGGMGGEASIGVFLHNVQIADLDGNTINAANGGRGGDGGNGAPGGSGGKAGSGAPAGEFLGFDGGDGGKGGDAGVGGGGGGGGGGPSFGVLVGPGNAPVIRNSTIRAGNGGTPGLQGSTGLGFGYGQAGFSFAVYDMDITDGFLPGIVDSTLIPGNPGPNPSGFGSVEGEAGQKNW